MHLFAPSRRAVRSAALVAAIGFTGIVVFQVALAAGVPLGHAAYGGAHAYLSLVPRSASPGAVLVWTAAALIVLGRAAFWGSGGHSILFRVGNMVLP